MALKWELETLRAFVRNAEAKLEEDNVWVVQLMEVTELLEHLHRASPQKKWTKFLLRAARWIGVLNSRSDRDSNLQIQNITTLLRAINERGKAYKLLFYEIDDDTVGLKLPSEELVQRLTGGGSRRSVYWKVEHVSSVLFWYRVEGNNYKLFKLGDPELLDHLRGLETNTNVIEHDRIELESSFCDSDEKEDEVPELSFSTRSSSRRSFSKQWSFSSGFYTDDVEE